MSEQVKISDIAKKFSVSRATVNRAIDKLDSEMNFKVKFVHESGNSKTSPKLVDVEGVQLLGKELGFLENKKIDEKQSIDSTEAVAILRSELDRQEKRIDELNQIIERRDAAIKRQDAEKAALIDLLKAQAGQLLQVNSSVDKLPESVVQKLSDNIDKSMFKQGEQAEVKTQEQPKKKGLFSFLKRK